MKASLLLIIAMVRSEDFSNIDQNTTNVSLSADANILLSRYTSKEHEFLRSYFQKIESRALRYKGAFNELFQKRLFNEFNCAILLFKSTTESCYSTFGLNKRQFIAEVHWPEDLDALTKEADYCVLPDGNKKWYARDSLRQSFLNWFVFLSHQHDITLLENDQHSIELNSKLNCYYTTHRDRMKGNPHFTDLTSFFKYVAATITRTYNLGCLLIHDVFPTFHEHIQLGNMNFIEIFNKVLPQWHFTETDMDIVNIIWLVGSSRTRNGKTGPTNGSTIRIGYRLVERDSIIPVSSDCPTAPFSMPKIDV